MTAVAQPRWMFCAGDHRDYAQLGFPWRARRFWWWAPHEGLKLVSPKRHRELAIRAIWFGTLGPMTRRERLIRNETEVCHASRVRESGRREGDRAGAERHDNDNQSQTLTGPTADLPTAHINRVKQTVSEASMSRPPSSAAPPESGEAHNKQGGAGPEGGEPRTPAPPIGGG